MKLLIVYGTTEGQTRKICEFISNEAREAGYQVSLVNSLESHIHPAEFDAVIVGSSVHAGRYQAAVEHYVHEHHQELNSKITAFLSVSLAAASDEEESWKELRNQTEEFLNKTGWNPTFVEQVAGALRYTKYNFLKKFIMRMIAKKSGGSTDTSKDVEYTDWEQVKMLLSRVMKEVKESKRGDLVSKR